jgi:hypothetical protein
LPFFVQRRRISANATVVGWHHDLACLGLVRVSCECAEAIAKRWPKHDGDQGLSNDSAFTTETGCEILARRILGLFDRSSCDRKDRTSHSRVRDKPRRVASRSRATHS